MKLKKTLAMLLVLCFTFALLPFGGTAYAAENEKITESFGSGFSFTFNPAKGVLTVSGEGELAFAEGEEAPWADFRDDIKELVIKEGITSIGESVFAGCVNLKKVTFPKTIKSIDEEAFSGCNSVQKVLSSGDAKSIVELTRIITVNGVAELELAEFAGTVNTVAGAYYVPQVQAATSGKAETRREVITYTDGNIEKTTWVEDGVTYEKYTDYNSINGDMEVLRAITENPDGTKTITETQKSADGNYIDEAKEIISADGKSSFRTSETTRYYTDADGVRQESKSSHTFTTQYNEDGTGQITETHDFGGGMSSVTVVQLNEDGKRVSSSSTSYMTITGENGAEQKVVTGYQTSELTYNEATGEYEDINRYFDADGNEIPDPRQSGGNDQQGGENPQGGESQQGGENPQGGVEP